MNNSRSVADVKHATGPRSNQPAPKDFVFFNNPVESGTSSFADARFLTSYKGRRPLAATAVFACVLLWNPRRAGYKTNGSKCNKNSESAETGDCGEAKLTIFTAIRYASATYLVLSLRLSVTSQCSIKTAKQTTPYDSLRKLSFSVAKDLGEFPVKFEVQNNIYRQQILDSHRSFSIVS